MTAQVVASVFCSDINDPDGYALKVAPPVEIAQTGLLTGSPMGRTWFNFYLNMFSTYSAFIQDEILGVGAVLSYVSGEEPDFVNDFLGTWVSIGTQPIGGVTVEYFRRTA